MELSADLVLFMWTIFILLDSGIGSLPGIYNRTFIEQCVREHNAVRSIVNPPANDMLYMSWDEALAITARAWSRRCEFEHNIFLGDASRVHPDFPSVGENLWVSSPPSFFTVKRAVEDWDIEKLDYNFQQNTCTKVCGHYTQSVWASTYKVGCAVNRCPNGIKSFNQKDGAIFVCNYATAGNVVGQHPYATGGAACSGCSGTCEQNLCRSPQREEERSYNWAPDWEFSSISAAGTSSFVSIVTIRPIGLILTFVVAYIVHYFYPDIFCYE